MLNFLRPQSAQPMPSVAEISDMVAKGQMVLIDVRELAELKAGGKAKGAMHIPLSMIPLHCNPNDPGCAKGLSTDKPVIVYCASGGRSGMAAQALGRLGYKTVHNLGGFGAWASAGGQIERV